MTDTPINDDVTITCPADREALRAARHDVCDIKLRLEHVLWLVAKAAKTHGYVCEQLGAVVSNLDAAIHDEIDPALDILTNELENNEGR